MSESLFIIAEAGVNHNGDLGVAIDLVDAAVAANADAVKFQSFAANRLVRKGTELVPYQKGTADDHFELLEGLELSQPDQVELARYASSKGIVFLSTPYSELDAQFLLGMGLEIIKVASADIVDIELHTLLASSKVKVFASTGMATFEEVLRLVDLYRSLGSLEFLWLMQCVSNYPAKLNTQNLRVLETYHELVGGRLGFSDHTSDSLTGLVALGAGARVFEKHLTLDKSLPGPDHKASLEPSEFFEYASSLRRGFETLGSNQKKPQDEELAMREISRKGVYLNRDIAQGEVITRDDVELLRPARGSDSWKVISELPIKSEGFCRQGDQLNGNNHD